jgi:hypothetical protein
MQKIPIQIISLHQQLYYFRHTSSSPFNSPRRSAANTFARRPEARALHVPASRSRVGKTHLH